MTRPKETKSVHEIVTEKILDAMAKGVAPWRRPWRVARPRNGASGRPYRGINQLLLGMTEYRDPRWFTYKQAEELGGQVRRGEKATLITFWKTMSKAEDETGKEKTFPLLRYFLVFNAEQIDGWELKPIAEENELETLPEPQAVLESFLASSGVGMKDGGERACYIPAKDMILLPSVKRFETPELFHLTAFHEAAHSTGHQSRLDRFANGTLGFEAYGKEELVAEMTAAFLAAETGIGCTLETSASYLEGWRTAIKADSKLVVTAASAAAKAADLVLGRLQAAQAAA